MHLANGHDYSNSGDFVLATDKRGRRLAPTQREGEWLPIGKLGSKAVYEVYPKRFVAVTPPK
jgi:hypothetical protein